MSNIGQYGILANTGKHSGHTPINILPTVDAGLNQIITLPTNTVTLTAVASDVDGSVVSYFWSKVSGPSCIINNANIASTIISSMVEGVYKFRVIVADNKGAKSFDTVFITVNPVPNIPPTANAGLNKTITLPTNFTSLSGSGSDVDGVISSYLWSQTSGPSSATIVSPNLASTSITNLIQGIYVFQLQVMDNNGAIATSSVSVTVNSIPNQVPIVNAGNNQTITLPTDSVALVGIANDVDGTISSYLWTQVSGPNSSTILTASTISTFVTGLVAGTYIFKLSVTDNLGAIGSASVTIIVNLAPPPNQPPIVNAGIDKVITLPTNFTNLIGSGSDSDGVITSYLWTKISGPSTYTINTPTTSTTIISNLVQGTYIFQLSVIDNLGAIGTDTVTIVVNQALNILPSANAGIDQIINLPANSVNLTGTGTDVDGTIVGYLWTLISGPNSPIIFSPTSSTTSVLGLIAGTYIFQLRVIDDRGGQATDTISILVNPIPNIAPIANAGIDQTVLLPTSTTTLIGSGIDSDGTIASYAWIQLSGPNTSTIVSPTSATTSVTGLIQGSYTFQLTVIDNQGASGTDVIQLTMLPEAQPTVLAQIALTTTSLPATPISSTTVNFPNTLSLMSASTGGVNIGIYTWTKVSGPTGGIIDTPAGTSINITSLIAGTYVFRLTVWLIAPWSSISSTADITVIVTNTTPAADYYVSPTGNDSNPGTLTQPFKNIEKLSTVMTAGKKAYIRGGVYRSPYSNVGGIHFRIQNLTGTATNPITIETYPGEVPIFNLDNIIPTDYAYGMVMSNCKYVHLKGHFILKNLKQVQTGLGTSRGFDLLNSNNCTIEWLEVYNMAGTGIILEDSQDNLFLNCDSHHNGDGISTNTDLSSDAWDNADGFSVTSNDTLPANTSTRNTFRGCRAWLNSDDGWDHFGTNGETHLDNCWSFWNSIRPWGLVNNQPTESTMTVGDPTIFKTNSAWWVNMGNSGEGFKLGPARVASTITIHYLTNCIAFENRGTGYASNSLSSLTGVHELWNCIAYANDNDGFSFGAGWCAGTSQHFKNNWAWGNNRQASGGDWVYDGNNSANISNNIWMTVYNGVSYGNLYPGKQVSNADFVSISSIGMDGPRQVNGSLPIINFLKLLPTSDLVNAGTNVGIAFNGLAPDLGAFEL